MVPLIFFFIVITLFFTYNLGKNPDEDIIILYTNDVHCGIDENIGYAGLSYYRDEVNKKTPYVSLVDAGDHVQGGAVGTISQGKYLIDIMNAIGYDLVTPGNHEFDYGMKQFEFFSKNLSCSYLSCNFRDLKNNRLVLKPYEILEYGEVKVAFIGISTPETLTKSVQNTFKDKDGNIIYDFDIDTTGEKLISSVQEAVNNARKEGADFVIAIGHLGETGDVTKIWSGPYIIEHTTGIDALIDGHTHEVIPNMLQKNLEGKEIPITQSGSRLMNIGQLTITKTGEIKTELIKPEMVKSKDERILKLIKKIYSNLDGRLTEIIAKIDFDLITSDEKGNRIIRTGETNLANLITDAILIGAKSFGKVDFSLYNAGNIRVPIKAGEITFENVMNVNNFNNEFSIVEIPGQSIIDALEMGARSYPIESGGFLHTSGLTYSIDPDIPSSVILDENNLFSSVSGPRRVHNIHINGKPIDPKKKYRMASSDYILFNHGDGLVFEESNVIYNGFGFVNDLLIDYIKNLGDDIKKYKEPQNRITFSKKIF